MTSYVIGLDLGQSQDYTALAVLEQTARDTGERRWTVEWEDCWNGGPLDPVQPRLRPVIAVSYAVRHLERLPLGTRYPDVVKRVQALLNGIDAAAGVPRRRLLGVEPNEPAKLLAVDKTGVGAPVVDLLSAAGLAPLPITIHGGD